MPKFLFLFRGRGNDEQKWKNWLDRLKNNGDLEDVENLMDVGRFITGPNKEVVELTYKNENITGLAFVKAGNIDDAVDVAKSSPVFDNNGEIEIREISTM